jgi:hypothetical protein
MAALSTRMGSLYVSSKGISASMTSSKKATRDFSKIAGTNSIQRTTKKSNRFHHYYPLCCRAAQSYVNVDVRAHSTAAVAVEAEVEEGSGSWDHNHYDKHCKTCTCEKEKHRSTGQSRQELSKDSDLDDDTLPPCGIPSIHYQNNQNQNQVTVTQTATATAATNELREKEDEQDDGLPPPLPEPAYSVRRRLLSDCPGLTALDSKQGHVLLIQALQQGTAVSYIPLTQHFTNQSEPAFCGVTTLLTVLNALAVDPGTRWRGGWRYFGNEDVLLSRCCLSQESIQRVGISMPEFAQLAACQGLRVTMKHPVVVAATSDSNTSTADTGGMVKEKMATVDDFRRDIRSVLVEEPSGFDDTNDDENNDNNDTKDVKGILVVSFARYALGQTGDGHFSPIAAYHEATDQCLVLDVARFKYQPYWVSVADLFASTLPVDSVTEKPRGWYILQPPVHSASYKGTHITTEERRPASLVPTVEEGDRCPVHLVKVEFCPVRRHDE